MKLNLKTALRIKSPTGEIVKLKTASGPIWEKPLIWDVLGPLLRQRSYGEHWDEASKSLIDQSGVGNNFVDLNNRTDPYVEPGTGVLARDLDGASPMEFPSTAPVYDISASMMVNIYFSNTTYTPLFQLYTNAGRVELRGLVSGEFWGGTYSIPDAIPSMDLGQNIIGKKCLITITLNPSNDVATLRLNGVEVASGVMTASQKANYPLTLTEVRAGGATAYPKLYWYGSAVFAHMPGESVAVVTARIAAVETQMLADLGPVDP